MVARGLSKAIVPSLSRQLRGRLGKLAVLSRVGEGDKCEAESVVGRLRLLVGVALGGGVGVCIFG